MQVHWPQYAILFYTITDDVHITVPPSPWYCFSHKQNTFILLFLIPYWKDGVAAVMLVIWWLMQLQCNVYCDYQAGSPYRFMVGYSPVRPGIRSYKTPYCGIKMAIDCNREDLFKMHLLIRLNLQQTNFLFWKPLYC